MMDNTYKHGQVLESQYARKHTQAIKAVLIKHLYFDYLWIYKCPGVIISNSAGGCFDRMALAVGSLAFCCLGVPWQAVWSLLNTLCNMKHFICTDRGDLEKKYEGTPQRPLQGKGQGNGAAGPMWIAISVVMLLILLTLPINATIVLAISLLTISMLAIMYVGDTNLVMVGDRNDDTASLTKKA